MTIWTVRLGLKTENSTSKKITRFHRFFFGESVLCYLLNRTFLKIRKNYTSIDPKQLRQYQWENRRSRFPTLIGKRVWTTMHLWAQCESLPTRFFIWNPICSFKIDNGIRICSTWDNKEAKKVIIKHCRPLRRLAKLRSKGVVHWVKNQVKLLVPTGVAKHLWTRRSWVLREDNWGKKAGLLKV